VIAADEKDADAGLVQPAQLVGEEARRLHRGLLAVIEIAGDHQRIDPLGKGEIDDADKGLPRRVADQAGEISIAQRQRAQRRIEMDVGGMDETKGGDRGSPRQGMAKLAREGPAGSSRRVLAYRFNR
jgi:hypothetical protein